MPEIPARPRVKTPPPPSRPAILSRHHHEQGAEHHLDRMYRYTSSMKTAAGTGELPSLEHALQVSADLARFIVHLSALKELDLIAAPPERPAVAAPVFRSAARRSA
jgi:hypothetical protein